LWTWSFGDGGTSTLKNPSHTYSNPGSYPVTLKVTGHMNGGSCDPTPTDTKTKTGYISVIESTAGTLSVTSSPVGATVSIDGTAAGSTPLTNKELTAGTHTVMLLLAGYEDYSREVTISRNTPVQMQVILSKIAVTSPSTGSIQVTTDPAGASVSVDGNGRGTAPVTITDLSSGQHTISITKDGYAGYTTKVTVTGGETIPLSLNLVPLPATTSGPSALPTPEDTTTPETTVSLSSGFGTLNIQSNPQGASIVIDGDSIGKTPMAVRNVEIGKHTVILSMSGYNATSIQAEVYAGSTTDVSHDFGKEKRVPGFGPASAAMAAALACLIAIGRRTK
jgi:PKD repeat protein